MRKEPKPPPPPPKRIVCEDIFSTRRRISDLEAERVAATIAGIRKRAQRRALLERIFTGSLYVVFTLLGILGVYLGFEIAAFLWEISPWQ